MDVGVYTIAEIARILKISEKTAYKLIRDQELPYIRVRGQIRITAIALDCYLQGGMQNEEALRESLRKEQPILH